MDLFCFLKIVLLLYTISHSVISSDDVEGYYWRDYKGVIYKDAFEAAYTNDNRPLYIGQVLHENQLIPARIDAFVQLVFYEWGRVENLAKDGQHVKILCTSHPEQMQWIQTGNGFIQNVQGKIEGGYEANISLYIGRKVVDNEYTVGKITIGEVITNFVYKLIYDPTNRSRLHTTKNGNVRQFDEFEVLTYNPNIRKLNQNTSINTSGDSKHSITKQIVINYYVY